jgi:hypothetical protein
MNSYFYPTEDGWFEDLLEKWKSSGRRELCFPFLWFRPSTLGQNQDGTFWMYMYYTKSKTEEPESRGTVKFRVRVCSYSFSVINGDNIYTCQDNEPEATVWFRCDIVEELRNTDGSFLKSSDFKHAYDVDLLSSVRNSIAPVKRTSPMLIVQTTGYALSD